MGAVEQGTGHRGREGGGCVEPTTPVAELVGRLACLDLSHPNAGSSPMPAWRAVQAQLKLSLLLFRARPCLLQPPLITLGLLQRSAPNRQEEEGVQKAKGVKLIINKRKIEY